MLKRSVASTLVRGRLADVLLRVQTYPQSRIHELLPKAWSELYGQQKAEEDQ